MLKFESFACRSEFREDGATHQILEDIGLMKNVARNDGN
jgi:transketolase C-terminal domain/subunit